MKRRCGAAALVLAAATGLAGCGLGPGGRGASGASMIVTRDFGTTQIASARADSLPASETNMRFLQRRFRVKTAYGGGYVSVINGLAEGKESGRPVAWLYFVNGIEAPKGAASISVHPGDRIWWDRHDYGATQTTPAIVGAFPAPFTRDLDGRRPPVRLECASDAGAACARVEQKLKSIGVVAARAVLGTGAGQNTLRVLVGPWASLRTDNAAQRLEAGPAASGVFVRPARSGRTFALLGATGAQSRSLGAGTGLVAATRFESQEPAWLITGTDAAGTASAAGSLDEHALQRRFALVTTPTGRLSAPNPAAP